MRKSYQDVLDTVLSILQYLGTLAFIIVLVLLAIGTLKILNNIFVLIPVLIVIYLVIHIDYIYVTLRNWIKK